MNSPATEITLALPQWMGEKLRGNMVYPSAQDKMEFVLDVLVAHIQNETGYPFAAAIFDKQGKVVSVGVNSGPLLNNSTAHAEMLAIQFAEAALEKPYLPKGGQYVLVTSAQPCAMCCAAIFSSAVRELVIAASEQDLSEILGFGTDLHHPQWRERFATKGIAIIEGIGQERAREILIAYKANASVPRPPVSPSVAPESHI